MNNKELQNIISQGENINIEFKENFNNDAIIALCAFANTKGGKVYIGISDSGKIKGIDIKQETIPIIINEVKNKTYPNIIPDTEIIKAENKRILIISIKEFPIKPVAVKGKYYKRVKNSNHQLNLQEIAEEHLKTLNSSWDYYIDTNNSIDDVSIKKIENFISKIENNKQTKIELSPFDFLSKLKILRNNKLTFGAYLLFAKDDTLISDIQIGRFKSNTKNDLIIHLKQFAK